MAVKTFKKMGHICGGGLAVADIGVDSAPVLGQGVRIKAAIGAQHVIKAGCHTLIGFDQHGF